MLSNMQQGVSLPNRIVHNGTYVRNWHRTTCRRICSDGIGAQRFRSLHFITNTWSTPGRKSMWTVSVQVKILENVPQQALWAMQNHGAAGTTNLCSDAKLCTFGLANLSDSKKSLLFAAISWCMLPVKQEQSHAQSGLVWTGWGRFMPIHHVWQHADSPLLLREGRGAFPYLRPQSDFRLVLRRDLVWLPEI